jgi:hypothetical protein
MKRIGQTQSEAARGRFLLLTLGMALLIGWLAFPNYSPTMPSAHPLAGINGLAWRYDDAAEVSYFLESLRLNDGVLCLGTSETTQLADGNWPDFLNARAPRYATLAGAGRTASVYLPIWARHSDELKGLKAIYYINPVYWNSEHGPINPGYWTRYLDPMHLASVDSLPSGIREPLIEARSTLPIAQAWNPAGWLRKARKMWFKNLRRWWRPSEFHLAFKPIVRWEGEPPSTPSPKWNAGLAVHEDFQHPEWFKPISDNPLVKAHRFKELQALVEAGNHWGMEITFLLGPYNAPFVRQHAPEACRAYEDIQAQISMILEAGNAHWIDLRELNEVPGAFRDHQHHSSYGAALIAQRILQP